MSAHNLALKCGIEIHQQLEGKKLFCDCPTIITEDNTFDFELTRRIRAVAGESGNVDVAAAQEQQKNRHFVYQGRHKSSCLVDTDSEPPHPINQDALYAALQFATIVKAKVSSVIPVMRKTVADGSNTSGFQRTALVARDGILETSEGPVRIEGVNIEEDSCRTINESKDHKTYHLDRLGIPLIEIGTAPDIKTPKQAQEAAKLIGSYLRSLPNCKRGLGTIRQDVNVSIKGGSRVEIKGAQDLKQIPQLIEFEMKRQHELLTIRDELTEKGITATTFAAFHMHDLTLLLENSKSKVLVQAFSNGAKVLALKLAGFSGYLGRELMPNYRLGTELAGRAKVKAGVRGLFHADELPNYGITQEEVDAVRHKLQLRPQDGFILVAAPKGQARRALEAVYERIQELFIGVPKEVRAAQKDATTKFLRPMPGAARMYPETDVPLIVSNDLGEIVLPELRDDKIARIAKDYSLANDLAAFLVKSDLDGLFETLASKHSKIKASFIAQTLGPSMQEIRRRLAPKPALITAAQFEELFTHLSSDTIHKDIVLDVLIDMAQGKFDLANYESLSTEQLHKTLKTIIEENKDAPFPALMGMSMKALAGKASGKVIARELQILLKQGHA